MIKVLGLTTLLDHLVRQRAQDRLHHGQMFAIVVSLKERHALKKLVNDAAERPDVTRLRPTQLEDDFRCAVVASRDDGGMVLVVECSGAKIDKTDRGV